MANGAKFIGSGIAREKLNMPYLNENIPKFRCFAFISSF